MLRNNHEPLAHLPQRKQDELAEIVTVIGEVADPAKIMYRKIIMNLLVGLLLPIVLKIRWLPNVYDALFKG